MNGKRVSKTKPRAPAEPTAAFKSQEYIVDSSDEDAAGRGHDVDTKPGGTLDESESSSSDSDRLEDESSVVSDSSEDRESDALTQKPVSKTINSHPYKAPDGYTAVEVHHKPRAQQTLLSQSALAGKQLWHITAPAQVPLSDMTCITLDSIRKRHVVLSHNGSEYVLSEDSSTHDAAKHLLIPSTNGQDYVVVNAPFQKTMHLRQKPPGLAQQPADSSIEQPATRRPKAQPKGLRMRYRPPGFGSGDVGSLDSEASDTDDHREPPSRKKLRLPNGHGVTTRPETDQRTTAQKDKILEEKRQRKLARQERREQKEAKRKSRVATTGVVT